MDAARKLVRKEALSTGRESPTIFCKKLLGNINKYHRGLANVVPDDALLPCGTSSRLSLEPFPLPFSFIHSPDH